MYKFDEAKILDREKKAAGLRKEIEATVDEIFRCGFKNVFFIGVGGTLSSAYVIQNVVETNSTLPLYVSNAGELIHMGNKNLTKDSVVYVESRSGDTPEVVKAVDYCKEIGAKVYGFIEKEESPLAKSVDVNVSSVDGGFYRIYYFFGYMMKKWDGFAQYDLLADTLEKLPEILIKEYQKVDEETKAYAEKYADESLNYVIGAGNTWGIAYCMAMCYMEEMQWMPTKSIHACEFFHGTLEVIEKGIPVLFFKGEDASREEIQRAEDFCNRVTNDITVFDSKKHPLDGIEPCMRGLLVPFLFHAYEERLLMNLENVNKHPSDIRRYYRRLTY